MPRMKKCIGIGVADNETSKWVSGQVGICYNRIASREEKLSSYARNEKKLYQMDTADIRNLRTGKRKQISLSQKNIPQKRFLLPKGWK